MNPWRHWQADYGPEGPYPGALGYRDYPGSYPYSEAGGGMRQRYWQDHEPGSLRRGPKGYKRSDERIREEICERLIYCDMVEVADVSIDVRDGKATLEGIVPERSMKHAIEDIVADTAGVEDIDNRIRVQRRQLLME